MCQKQNDKLNIFPKVHQKLKKAKDFNESCQILVDLAQNLIGFTFCSLYLIPDFVKKFDGELINAEGSKVYLNGKKKRFIVLSAHSNPAIEEKYLGKLFYYSGEGITGWVFRERKKVQIFVQPAFRFYFHSRL